MIKRILIQLSILYVAYVALMGAYTLDVDRVLSREDIVVDLVTHYGRVEDPYCVPYCYNSILKINYYSPMVHWIGALFAYGFGVGPKWALNLTIPLISVVFVAVGVYDLTRVMYGPRQAYAAAMLYSYAYVAPLMFIFNTTHPQAFALAITLELVAEGVKILKAEHMSTHNFLVVVFYTLLLSLTHTTGFVFILPVVFLLFVFARYYEFAGFTAWMTVCFFIIKNPFWGRAKSYFEHDVLHKMDYKLIGLLTTPKYLLLWLNPVPFILSVKQIWKTPIFSHPRYYFPLLVYALTILGCLHGSPNIRGLLYVGTFSLVYASDAVVRAADDCRLWLKIYVIVSAVTTGTLVLGNVLHAYGYT